ncbi:MAG: response regulator transcription factor [Marinilabiliales bacterium]|nr:response regulator transcription factor [Marinilabiliales bacterium]
MRILIADDHAIVREGVKLIVKTLPEVKQIDEASDGKEALSKLTKNKYDLAILDISMPEISGLDLLQQLKFQDIPTRVLILSFHPQEQYAVRAFKLGASGYLSKDSAFEELATAIRKIAAGGKYVSAAFAEKLLFNEVSSVNQQLHESLSEREFQVMILLAKGKSVTEIANEIFISDKTVATYRTRIMEKMQMKKNAELTIYALRNKLIE